MKKITAVLCFVFLQIPLMAQNVDPEDYMRFTSDLDVAPLARWGELLLPKLQSSQLQIREQALLRRGLTVSALENMGIGIGGSVVQIPLGTPDILGSFSIFGCFFDRQIPESFEGWSTVPKGLRTNLEFQILKKGILGAGYDRAGDLNVLSLRAGYRFSDDIILKSDFRIENSNLRNISSITLTGLDWMPFVTQDSFFPRGVTVVGPQFDLGPVWFRPQFRTQEPFINGLEVLVDIFNLVNEDSASPIKALHTSDEELLNGKFSPAIFGLGLRTYAGDPISSEGNGQTEAFINASTFTLDSVGGIIAMDLSLFWDRNLWRCMGGESPTAWLAFSVRYIALFPL